MKGFDPPHTACEMAETRDYLRGKGRSQRIASREHAELIFRRD